VLLTVASAAAAVVVGAEWFPPGVGAQSWSDAGSYTDSLAGEFDGWVRPALLAHAGWSGGRNAVLASVGFADFSTVTLADHNRTDEAGALRLGADWRRYLWDREARRVGLYGLAGGYGTLALVVAEDDAYTDAEQADADESAAHTKAQLGGIGLQAGFGAEYAFPDGQGRPAVALGVRYAIRVHRGEELDNDQGYTVSTVWLGEAAVVLDFVR
jgi:hypothetical protein